MKGFGIYVKNALLEPKHIEKMGIAVWLYLWLLDKMTSISEEGIGKVFGGKPVTFEVVSKELGISVRTYRRWVNQLHKTGYINLVRTPYGLVISVNKAEKIFGNNAEVQKAAHHNSRSATNGTSLTKNGTSNKTIQLDNTVRKERNVIKKEISDNDLEEISEKYKVPIAFVKLQKEKMENWQKAKGKIYKDKKAALRNWVIKAAEEKIERGRGNDRYGYTEI